MADDALQELTQRLNDLIRAHKQNTTEIRSIRDELLRLGGEVPPAVSAPRTVEKRPPVLTEKVQLPAEQVLSTATDQPIEKPLSPKPKRSAKSLEEFVGGNLIGKLGIAILVLGLGFFVKFAVDNSLLSPTLRIAGGFLAGIALIGLAYWLKEKYLSYSALLLGGGLSVLYFTTFAAYSFYELFPQPVAFGLMLVFTLFGVAAAYLYDVQMVAIIGLVGAYAVPPLLSDGGGEIQTMFAYMLIINLGVLAVALRKDWRLLNYIAFGLSWLIMLGWYSESYEASKHFGVALGFSFGFFLIFYGVLLGYKFLRNTPFSAWDVALLLLNAFFFFGIGYASIERGWPAGSGTELISGDRFLGLFTLGNAVIHFAAAASLFRRNMADKNLFYLVAGLVLTFLSIAVPVQLDGNWVTLLWAMEAALLFWIGQREGAHFYQWLALPLILLATGSWMHDMSEGYAYSRYSGGSYELIPLLNLQFLTSIVVCLSMVLMIWLGRERLKKLGEIANTNWMRFFQGLLVLLLLIVAYFGGLLELSHGFYQSMGKSAIDIEGLEYFNPFLSSYQVFWLICYSLAFWGGINLLHARFWKQPATALLLGIVLGITTLVFLSSGLLELSDMRESYLYPSEEGLFTPKIWLLLLRYVGYAFLTFALYGLYQSIKQSNLSPKILQGVTLGLYAAGLVVLCAEVKHLYLLPVAETDLSQATDLMHRVGYSVLGGLYSLAMIGIGFWRKQAFVRIGAFVLFGLTLVKVFLFDMANSSAGNKTVVFIALGALLLVIAFVYQRFKHLILGEESSETVSGSDADESE